MPRKRSELARDHKVDEILALAERQLVDGGAEALSIAGIARELGLAQNTVYWYFPSRAHLFVATLRRMLYAIAARKPRGKVDPLQRILWWTDQFAVIYTYRLALQRQAAESEVVADFVRELDETLDRMLGNAFRERVPAEELSEAAASFRATVTGTYAQGLSRARRRAILSYTLARLWRA